MKTHNRLMALTLSLALILPMVVIPTSVSATEEMTTSSEWEYVEYTYTCGTEDTSDDIQGLSVTKYSGSQTDVYVPSKLEVNGEVVPVIKLADDLFKEKAGLNSVTLGEGILEIGASTFEGATNLVCIVTPQSLTTIGANAFSGCTAFNSIILYDAVTNIGENAFLGCDNLTIYCNENNVGYNYALANGIPYIILNPNATPEEYTVDGITYYIQDGEAYPIAYDGTVTELIIPSTIEGYPVKKITTAFSNSIIKSISLPDTIIEISTSAFANCTSLETVCLSKGIVSISDSMFSGCTKLNNVIIPYGVTEIGGSSFSGCTSLSEIELPSTLIKVGKIAFSGCTSLVKIHIPDGVTEIEGSTFARCTSLSEIELPSTLTKVGNNAFSGCTSLVKIHIPDGVTELGTEVFHKCSSLRDVYLPNSILSIGGRTFSECGALETIDLPDNISKIDYMLFEECDALTHIKIPDSVTTIKYNAFSGCGALVDVTLPDNLKKIENHAFYGCPIVKIYLPATINSIDETAFRDNVVLCVHENSYAYEFAVNESFLIFVTDGTIMPEIVEKDGITYFLLNGEATALHCEKSIYEYTIPEMVEECTVTTLRGTFRDHTELTRVSMPDTIKEIGNYTFYNCDKLADVTIPNGVEKLGKYAFSHCWSLIEISLPENITEIEGYLFAECTNLEKVEIPVGVESIGEYAFSQCSFLKNLNLPKGLTTIGYRAFYKCKKLSEITIPESVTLISSKAFGACTSLKEIKLPVGVTYVSGYAFEDCTSLSNVILPETLTKIGISAFDGCTSLRSIFIPSSVKTIENYAFEKNTVLCAYDGAEALIYAKENGYLYYVTTNGETPEIISHNGMIYCIADGNAIAISYTGNEKKVTIPNAVEGYPVTKLLRSFYGNSKITSVVLPDSLIEIGDETFSNCYSLVSVDGGSNLRIIGESAFCECTKLVNFDIPKTVTQIKGTAFFKCRTLTTVNLPEGLVELGDRCFQYCESLKTIDIPKGITQIKRGTFQFCYKLESVLLHDGITEIGGGTFGGCEALKDITIPAGVTKIDTGVFAGCDTLTKIALPESVKQIDNSSFSDCINLKEISISEGTEFIGEKAFANTAATKVVIPSSVTTMYANSFPSTTVLLVYENSYAHTFAVENNLLYFVIHKTGNPEIDYGAGITGTATYTDGDPVSNATVEILYDDGIVKEIVTTDANGNYTFTYAEVGRYTIRVKDSLGNTASETVSVKRMNVFDVFLTGETDLVLKKGCNVSGTVSPESSTITLTDTYGNVIVSATTIDGNFSFENIPNGTYVIKAETETGSVSREITVFGEDLVLDALVIPETSATVTGYVEVEDRDYNHHRRNWVHVTIYNSEGVAIASQKTDADGKYTFKNIPVGDYSIVAETEEMRPDKKHGYNRSHVLTGYAYVRVSKATTYEVETIVLYEENDHLVTISGKVTAQGETQNCEVILKNVFRHEIAKITTGNNGKYTFKNVPDGLYFIIAETESNGMGFAVVVVRGGIIYGNTDIFVHKSDRIRDHEDKMHAIPKCSSRDDALIYKDKIREEKEFYDGLSDKEKRQLSKEYVERLNRLSEWIVDCEYTENGGSIENGGLIVSKDELESEDKVEFVLNIEKKDKHEKSTDGVNNENDYIQHKIEDTAGDRELVEYYDITLTKNGKEIKDVHKHTETTGKLRITMPIPEEYRGHKHYSFIHMHNGEARTLVDLDDDPNTVTFEVDRFSTFALAYTDTELVEEEQEEYTIKFSIYETGFESEPVEELEPITGTTITMPSCTYEREGYIFVGWVMSDGRKVLLPAGAEFTPEADTEFVPAWLSINMQEGATVRLAEPTGLRFTSTIDTDGYNIIKAIDSNAYCGTIITPIELVLGKEFTKQWMNVNDTPYLDVVNKGFADENETTKTWRSVIANVDESNYNREFAGRAYIEFTYTNGKTVTMYSDFNEEENARAIAQVAKYELENNSEKYTPEQLEILESYAQHAE